MSPRTGFIPLSAQFAISKIGSSTVRRVLLCKSDGYPNMRVVTCRFQYCTAMLVQQERAALVLRSSP